MPCHLRRKARHSPESGNPPDVGPRLRGDDDVCNFQVYGWVSLDKRTMRGMGQFLARAGYLAFSVDYRLLQGDQNR